jgi:two-component system, LytTR family, sensor kinase
MKKSQKLLIHILFWFYFLNQQLFSVYIGKMAEAAQLKEYFFGFGLFFIVFYLFYFSIPVFMKFRYLVFSILGGLAFIALVSLATTVIDYLSYKTIFYTKKSADMPLDWIWYFSSFRLVFIHAIYAILIRFTIDWFETQKLKSQLILQNKASELALLRSQVNPHFLFNTLNNIYSLVYQKSEDAPAALMKLSSIMRYMLYDANTDKVLLEKEVEYLQSFIELQKLRLRQQDFVELSVQGNLNGRTIAPMLLIPFVENAFKHGSKSASNPGIRINLTAEPEKLFFEVSNYTRKNPATTEESGGIGLHNIQRRLDLLYPGKHSLVITENPEIFNVKLIIETI